MGNKTKVESAVCYKVPLSGAGAGSEARVIVHIGNNRPVAERQHRYHHFEHRSFVRSSTAGGSGANDSQLSIPSNSQLNWLR